MGGDTLANWLYILGSLSFLAGTILKMLGR